MEKLHRVMEQVLDFAKQAGATATEVDAEIETGFSATARMAETETVEYHRDNSVSITVYVGQRSGTVTTSDLREASLKNAVQAAVRIAKYTEEDPDACIAQPEQLNNQLPELDIYYPWDITPEQAIQLAIETDQCGLDYDSRITNSEGCTVSSHSGNYGFATSNGFIGQYQTTRHNITSVLVAEKNNEMQRDYYYYTARDANDLPSLKTIGETAAKTAISRLEPQPIKTGKMPILFSPTTARQFIAHFVKAVRGTAIYQQSSFLLDKLQQPIFPEWLSISEQPHLAKGLGSAPYDADGILTYAKTFVNQGVLEQYALGCYTAKKLNAQSTANAGGLHNVIVTPGERDLSAMLAELNTGFYITEVMGPGVNIVTGDYSRGACGFWVENGEIQYAVDEATIASNLSNMFKHIRCVGKDVDTRGKIHCSSILIDDVMVAGG